MIIKNNILQSVNDIDAENGIFVIPETINAIEHNAFSGCFFISDVIIPNSVKTIGDFSFNFCGSIHNITIADNINTIGKFAFSYCNNISTIKLPHNLIAIGKSAFLRNAPNLTIIFDESQFKFARAIEKEYGYKINLVLKPYNCDVF